MCISLYRIEINWAEKVIEESEGNWCSAHVGKRFHSRWPFFAANNITTSLDRSEIGWYQWAFWSGETERSQSRAILEKSVSAPNIKQRSQYTVFITGLWKWSKYAFKQKSWYKSWAVFPPLCWSYSCYDNKRILSKIWATEKLNAKETCVFSSTSTFKESWSTNNPNKIHSLQGAIQKGSSSSASVLLTDLYHGTTAYTYSYRSCAFNSS